MTILSCRSTDSRDGNPTVHRAIQSRVRIDVESVLATGRNVGEMLTGNPSRMIKCPFECCANLVDRIDCHGSSLCEIHIAHSQSRLPPVRTVAMWRLQAGAVCHPGFCAPPTRFGHNESPAFRCLRRENRKLAVDDRRIADTISDNWSVAGVRQWVFPCRHDGACSPQNGLYPFGKEVVYRMSSLNQGWVV